MPPVVGYQVVADDDPLPGTGGARGTSGTGGSSGTMCICAAGYTIHGTDEFGHATCEPVPPCPAGFVQRSDIDGGTRCYPIPANGKCPTGFTYVSDSAGARCI